MKQLLCVTVAAFGLLLPSGCDSGESTAGLSDDANLIGVVEGDDGPVRGATVIVHGTSPPNEATTNGSGRFGLVVPPGVPLITATADGHWGGSTQRRIAPGQVIDDLELDIASDARVAELTTELGRPVSSDLGIVVVQFFASNHQLGGESASLSVGGDAPFTLDADELIVEQPTIIAGTDHELIFTNVPTGPFEVTPVGDGSRSVCSPELSLANDGQPLSQPHVIMQVRVFCAAVQ